MRIHLLSAAELVKMIKSGEVGVVEVVRLFLERIRKYDRHLNAFLELADEEALKRAEQLERLPSDKRGPLFGLPIAVKDNILVSGIRATAGSKILSNFTAPYNATVIDRLLQAGVVILGKTNLDEFGMGSSCEYSAFGPTLNPWDRGCVPGGSSGGSAAAVAAHLTPAALGTDTGGSVRQPAAFCGITGHKPTYGLLSRYGLIAYASSLDQIGPMAQTAHDCLLLLSVMAGPDVEHDATTSPNTTDLSKSVPERLRIGVVRRAIEASDEGVAASVEKAIAVFAEEGHTIKDVDSGPFEDSLAAYYIIATAEASSNLARYTGVHYANRPSDDRLAIGTIRKTRSLFGTEVKRRILLGTYVLSAGYYDAYYLRAVRYRRSLRKSFLSLLQNFDILLMPTSPTTAFRLGERLDDPLKMYAADLMTVGVNLAGLPSVSLPCGFSNGLPVGMQFVGRPFEDAKILSAAIWFQNKTDHHKKSPPAFED